MFVRFFRSLYRQLIRISLSDVTFTYLTRFYQSRFTQVTIRLLSPSAIFISLALRIAINQAASARASQAKDTIPQRASSASVVYRVLSTRLYSRASVIRFNRRFFFRFCVPRDATVLITDHERFIVVVYEDRLRHRRILFNEDATSGRYSVVEKADDHARYLSLFSSRKSRDTKVRSHLYFLVRMDLVNKATALYRARRLVFRAFHDFSVSLNKRITFNIRFIMRIRKDILQVTRILFHVNFVCARQGYLFVTMTDPCLLSLFTMSSDHANVLTREGCALDDGFYIARRDRHCVFVIVAYFQVARSLDRLLIIQTTGRGKGVARDNVDRYHGAFFLCFRGQNSFRLKGQGVVFYGRVVLYYVQAR